MSSKLYLYIEQLCGGMVITDVEKQFDYVVKQIVGRRHPKEDAVKALTLYILRRKYANNN